MASVINTNVMSLNAQRNLAKNQMSMSTTIQRLSSGLRINSAKDDAAGLAVAEGMTSQIRGLGVAVRNANDGISLSQTAEGALGQVTNNLQRMRELAVQSANEALADKDRMHLQKEMDQLTAEVARIVDTTEFNGQSLLDAVGGATTDMNIQVGPNGTDQIAIKLDGMKNTGGLDNTGANGLNTYYAANNLAAAASGLGGPAQVSLDITTAAGGTAAITALDSDLNITVASRATLGAVQNRFESVISNLTNYSENLQAARSRIMDTDFAAETAAMTRNQILTQAGTSMVAQANQVPQGVLSLLQ
ncbi:MAG: flagellin N-terminal helical domain-containing protein [bacterium]